MFDIDGTWLARELEGTDVRVASGRAPGRVTVRSQKSGGSEFLVQAHIDAAVAADCVRCLGEAVIPVHLDVTTIFAPRPAGLSEEEAEERLERAAAEALEEDDGADLSREYYGGDEIVLDRLVRENVLLEVPMQPLCAENCPGIEIPAHVRPPADFGKGAEVDERLAPLKKLAEKLTKS